MPVKLEWLGYRMVKKLWQYVEPFSSDTGALRTNRWRDRQMDRIAIIFIIIIKLENNEWHIIKD